MFSSLESQISFLFFYYTACGAHFDNFVSKLDNFQSLSDIDMWQTNGRNLYLNYIFARYATAETVEEQLWWLFDGLDSQKCQISRHDAEHSRVIQTKEVLNYFGNLLGQDSSEIFR